jgi:hypothetical protein
MGWQFNVPESHRGFLQAFRRGQSGRAQMTMKPRGLSPTVEYRLFNYETEETWVASGAALMVAGIPVALPEPGSATTIRYWPV